MCSDFHFHLISILCVKRRQSSRREGQDATEILRTARGGARGDGVCLCACACLDARKWGKRQRSDRDGIKRSEQRGLVSREDQREIRHEGRRKYGTLRGLEIIWQDRSTRTRPLNNTPPQHSLSRPSLQPVRPRQCVCQRRARELNECGQIHVSTNTKQIATYMSKEEGRTR